MFGKAGYSETTKLYARRGPDGMVNATLHEPKYPLCKRHWPGYGGKHPGSPDNRSGKFSGEVGMVKTILLHAPGDKVAISNLKGTKWAPTAVLNVTQARNAGSPTGREPYGDGAPVVVRGRENRLHGEGGQASRMDACGGTCDA